MLARGAQRLREAEAAPERIAVGVLVTEDQDLLVGVDELLDLGVEAAGFTLGGGYRASSWFLSPAGSTSLSSSLM
jgi:hypothetical protein